MKIQIEYMQIEIFYLNFQLITWSFYSLRNFFLSFFKPAICRMEWMFNAPNAGISRSDNRTEIARMGERSSGNAKISSSISGSVKFSHCSFKKLFSLLLQIYVINCLYAGTLKRIRILFCMWAEFLFMHFNIYRLP